MFIFFNNQYSTVKCCYQLVQCKCIKIYTGNNIIQPIYPSTCKCIYKCTHFLAVHMILKQKHNLLFINTFTCTCINKYLFVIRL
jgi:hypothetical protein